MGGEPQSNGLWLQLLLPQRGFGSCNCPPVGAAQSQETRVPIPASNTNFLSSVFSQTNILASADASLVVLSLLLQGNHSKNTQGQAFLACQLNQGLSVSIMELVTILFPKKCR